MAAQFTNIQFEMEYDGYKMRALVDDLARQFGSTQGEFVDISAILAAFDLRISILEAQDESDSFLEWGM